MIELIFTEISSKISALKCCVVIPTYNNQNSLEKVILGVLKYTNHIIIVNDGCTDNSDKIIKKYHDLTQIHFQKNKGKGAALRAGFAKATASGYHYGITIDSDGQHYPEDIPVFIEELEKHQKSQDILLIGSRNMTHESVPKNSSFGNKFSNFWYRVETGINLSDTQSGFRLYPLNTLKNIKFYTTKFEFEIESIVKLAWRGVEVKNVPIKVLYPKDRISHFRPIKDFIRISILNTWLVLVAFLFIKPRNLIRKLRSKGLKKFFIENVLHHSDNPSKKAFSIALGVFIGIAPFWGFQTVLVLALAVFLNLNKVIAFAFSNISIPPMIPVIIYGSIKLGDFLIGQDSSTLSLNDISTNTEWGVGMKAYLVGSFALAAVAAIIFGTLGFLILKFSRQNSGKQLL